ncbi:MAG: PDDEXK nuclease domain-containing protein [Clostridia bacterium]
MNKPIKIEDDKDYELLINSIETVIANSKNKIANSINDTMVETYWNVGKHIIEFEQKGNLKAEYGKQLLLKLSKDLKLCLGKGFSRSNLYNMRKIYELYPIFQPLAGKLSWTNLCEILTISDELERNFYIEEASKEKWSKRTLQRQMESGLFLKLAISKDKNEILALVKTEQEINEPKDIIKSIYTLDFLNLVDKTNYSENQLEEKIIEKLEEFLLELGKGFTFVGRQYPIHIGNDFYHADLVFYHRILKCFVIIDLKINKVKHEDIRTNEYVYGLFCYRRK